MNKYLVVNFDRKEYIRPEAFGESADMKSVIESYDGVMLGLAVLLADSNNRGGGDLRSDAEIIGTWSGNRIAIVDDVVAHPAYCEPGMEHVPLQQQMLALGKDVSKDVIAAIKDGEGEYSTLSQLNDRHIVPMTEQRKMSDDARKLFIRKDGWLAPFSKLEHAFEVLGVDAGLTPYMAKRRLQEGIDKMAAVFGVISRPTVRSVQFEPGKKQIPTGHRDHTQTISGILSMTVELADDVVAQPGSTEVAATRFVTFQFNGPLSALSSTAQDVYRELLGVTTFEREPEEAVLGVKSPEVAKLLSMIPNLGA